MIKGFRCKHTENLFNDLQDRKFISIENVARRKLEMLDAAGTLDDLLSPPGNRLETLRGNRAGQYSIRINAKWRICFKWLNGAAEDVEIVDYH